MKSLIRIAAVVAVVVTALAFTSTSFAKEKAAKATAHVFTGAIDAIDTTATPNTVTVKNRADESKTFSVTADTKISTGDKKEAAIGDLKAGDKVAVQYVEADGKLTAKSIKAVVPKAKK